MLLKTQISLGFHSIMRLMLYVIMSFIFYFRIGCSTALTAYHTFAIDFICEFCHIHLVQAFVLKPLKAGIGKILAIYSPRVSLIYLNNHLRHSSSRKLNSQVPLSN